MLGVVLGGVARDEEAAFDSVFFQQVQNPGHADLGAVLAHCHGDGPVGEVTVAPQPRADTVNVEADVDRALDAVFPETGHLRVLSQPLLGDVTGGCNGDVGLG